MNRTIHVLGAVNFDSTLTVRHFPGPGETTHAEQARSSIGGKGANQAIAAAAAGARVRMCGAVGCDEAARAVAQALAASGVDDRGVRRAELPTGQAQILVDSEGENMIVLLDGANGALGAADAELAVAPVGASDILLLQNEIAVSVSRTASRLARARGAMVIWNAAPAPASTDDLIEADVTIVNETELLSIARALGAQNMGGAGVISDQLILEVANRLSATWVVCTLGAEGAVAAGPDGVVRIPSPRVHAIDTTGAGDAFIGYFAAALAAEAPITSALNAAAAAGALAVTRAGAAEAIPSHDQVLAQLASCADQHQEKEGLTR